jgi:hypothetical protein
VPLWSWEEPAGVVKVTVALQERAVEAAVDDLIASIDRLPTQVGSLAYERFRRDTGRAIERAFDQLTDLIIDREVPSKAALAALGQRGERRTRSGCR